MALVFPILWIPIPYIYFTRDGCLPGQGNVACGNHALLVMAVSFIGCMAFPYIYFFKVLPALKKQEEDSIRKVLKEEFDEGEK